MPFIANAANQIALQNASNLGDGLAAVGQALNNPQAWANADLMRVQKEKLQNDIDIQQKTFGLTQQKQPYELGLINAQIGAQGANANANNAQAGYYNANRGKVETETQFIVGRWNAQNRIGEALSALPGVSPEQANAAQAIALASNDSNSQQLGNMINTVMQRDPVKSNAGDRVFYSPGDPRFTGVGTAVAGTSSAPTANYVDVPPAPRSAVGSPSTLTKTLKYAEGSIGALGLADEARRLNDPTSLDSARNPAGGIPLLSNVVNWYQQFSGDPAAADRNAYTKLGVSDFLSNVEKMKGAITEREGAYLRSTQPPDYADATIKSKWLESVEYTARMQADWDDALATATQNGAQIPSAIDWKQAYLQNNPQPELLAGLQRSEGREMSVQNVPSQTAINPPRPGRKPLSSFHR